MINIADFCSVFRLRARAPIDLEFPVSVCCHDLAVLRTRIAINIVVREAELVTDFVRDGDGVSLRAGFPNHRDRRDLHSGEAAVLQPRYNVTVPDRKSVV